MHGFQFQNSVWIAYSPRGAETLCCLLSIETELILGYNYNRVGNTFLQLDCYSPFCCSFIVIIIFFLSFLCCLVLFCFLFLFPFTPHLLLLPFTSHLPPTTSLQPPFPFSHPYCPPDIFHPSSFTSHHFTIPSISPSTFHLFHFIVYSLWSVEVYLYIFDGPVMGRRVRVSVFSGYTRMGDYIGIMPL